MKISKKNKKGVSGVIVTLILIALSMFLGSIVWLAVNNLITNQLDDAGSCFNVFEEVKINRENTCYDYGEDELAFSISIEDVEIEGVFVSIKGEETFKNFEITNELKTISGLRFYNEEIEGGVKLPEKKAGKTYIYEWDREGIQTNTPKSIEIAPKVDQKRCSTSDSLESINLC